MTSIESVILEVPDPAVAEELLRRRVRPGRPAARRASRGADQRLPRLHALARGLAAEHRRHAPRHRPRRRRDDTQARQEELLGLRRRRPAPDGTIWKVATSSKKNTGPATRQIDDFVLLLGVDDVTASKRFYVDRGLTVAKSFGGKYVEFATPSSPVKLALYRRRALPRTPVSPPDGTGSHRIAIGSEAGPFTDPDGFAWEARWREQDGDRLPTETTVEDGVPP